MVALPSKACVEAELDFLTTCAFCLRTSAGVRMKQETSSATDEAAECINGVGIKGVFEGPKVGFSRWRILFVPS